MRELTLMALFIGRCTVYVLYHSHKKVVLSIRSIKNTFAEKRHAFDILLSSVQ